VETVAQAPGTFDPIAFKAGQRKGWDDAARGWQEQAHVTDRVWGFINNRLIELARITPGDRVLDLASGIGEPALTVARQVGPSGQVVVTDLSPSMLAIAHERAGRLGLTNVEFHEMDAEAIDLPDRSFDAVTCRFGLMFLPDVLKGLQGVHRVLVPGGRLAAMTSRTPEPNVWAEWVFAPIHRALGVAASPPPGAPGIFALGDPARIDRLLVEAGFAEIRVEIVSYMNDFESGEELAAWQFAISAPIRQMLAGHSPEKRQAAWQAVADTANRHADPNGRVRVAGLNVEISAERPA
jgi:ubiquinone/menaquinone biosynthesis C-methylase UbiE